MFQVPLLVFLKENLGLVQENPGTTIGNIRIADRLHQFVPARRDGRPSKIVCDMDVGAHRKFSSAQKARSLAGA